MNFLTVSPRRRMDILMKRIGRNLSLGGDAPASAPSARRAGGRRLRKFVLLAAAAIFLSTLLCPATGISQQDGAPKVPNFSILANDGLNYSPSELKGNVVLFMFWETWCPYCKKAMPHMSTFARDYANAPFTLLGICGSESATAWRNYIQEHQLQWPQYLDSDHRMGQLFGARGVERLPADLPHPVRGPRRPEFFPY